MKKTKLPIYLIDHKLRWKAFQILHDKLVKDSGPTPQQATKTIWQMMRDKQIYCWFDQLNKNDMNLGIKLPKDREIHLITNVK